MQRWKRNARMCSVCWCLRLFGDVLCTVSLSLSSGLYLTAPPPPPLLLSLLALPLRAIDLDDVTFHQCVNLSRFQSEKTVSFVPPDGEFELMKYRVTEGVILPFKVMPVIREMGRSRIELTVKIKTNGFSQNLFANNVIVRIPVPKHTARATTTVSSGKAKYKSDQNAVIWKIKRFPGQCEATLSADVELVRRPRGRRVGARVSSQLSLFAAPCAPRPAGPACPLLTCPCGRTETDLLHVYPLLSPSSRHLLTIPPAVKHLGGEEGVEPPPNQHAVPGAHVHVQRPARALPQGVGEVRVQHGQVGTVPHPRGGGRGTRGVRGPHDGLVMSRNAVLKGFRWWAAGVNAVGVVTTTTDIVRRISGSICTTRRTARRRRRWWQMVIAAAVTTRIRC